MAEWNNTYLSDVLVDKGYIRGPFGSALKRGDMKDNGIPVYEQQHAIYNSRHFRYYIDEQKFNEMKRFQVNTDDLIISCSGTVGKVSIIRSDDPKGIISQALLLLRVDQNKILPLYLKYFFTSRDGYNAIVSRSSGSVQVNIAKRNVIEQIPLMLPKIETQRKIVEILNSIDKKIEENEEINNNLEQQAQAIYRSWFVNYEPFDGTKPDDWSDGTIDDLGTEIICGKTPSTKKSEYYGGNTPFITIPDMHGCVYIVSTERYLSDAGVASQPKKTLPPNTVCVSCIGTAGLVTLVSEESQSNQQINSIIPKEGISVYYIYLLMQTLADTINKLGQSGSTIVNLNKTQFGKIQVMIPSELVLQDFDSLCRPLFDTILSNQKENINLSELRDALLPKLMSGELDVSDIDL